METVDMILFGGAGMFVLVVFALLKGPAADKKLRKRIERATPKGGTAIVKTSQTVSLRKQESGSGAYTRWTRLFPKAMGTIRERIDMAGKQYSIDQYVMRSAMILLLVSGAIVMLGKPIGLALFVGLVAAVGLPHFYLGILIARRKKTFMRLLPDAIDLIVRGLRAGLPVGKSMQTVVEEIGDPVSRVFHEIVEQIALGVTLEKALFDMALRLRMTEFDFFVTSIVLQRETGGNLSEILNNLSEVLRQRTMFRFKIKAMSSEARASMYILGALPFFVFGILNILSPDYVDNLYTDFRGNIACLIGFGMLSVGSFVMYKMTQFEI